MTQTNYDFAERRVTGRMIIFPGSRKQLHWITSEAWTETCRADGAVEYLIDKATIVRTQCGTK